MRASRQPSEAARKVLAELAAWESRLAGGGATERVQVLEALTHWIEDPDFASLRDEPALAVLPESEREECRALWSAVETLRRRAEQDRQGGA